MLDDGKVGFPWESEMNPPREVWVVVDRNAYVEQVYDTEQGAADLCRWFNNNGDREPFAVVRYVIAEGDDHAKV